MYGALETIDQIRFETSSGGLLVQKLLSNGLLQKDDLANPDIIDLINSAEETIIPALQKGDNIILIDEKNPKRMMVRAIVVYAGKIQVLAYNEKHLVDTEGIKVHARDSFPSNQVSATIQKFIPQRFEVTDLFASQKVFKIIKLASENLADVESALIPEA